MVASSPEATESPFHFSYDYNRKDYSDWENRRITPPFPPWIMPPLRSNETKFLSPMWLGVPGEADLEASIKMPDGYSPELPQARDVTRDFAEYHASYELNKGVLTAKRRLILKLREVPVSEFEEYKSFRKALEDKQNRYIVLTAHDSSSPPELHADIGNPAWILPDSDNPEAMHGESPVQAKMQMHDMAGTIASLRRAVAADPEFTRAWVLLAQLYIGFGKSEEGIEAFHRAVASDPKSPIPLKMLAFALNGAQRPDEAIKTWQKLLKLTPQDHDATAILGGLLSKPEAIRGGNSFTRRSRLRRIPTAPVYNSP